MKLAKIEDAVKDIQRGHFVILVDDENRENEGDLVIAAEKATASKINFMISKGKGLVCMPVIKQRLDELKLPLIVKETNMTRCAFTVPVDYKNGTTTGISAFDRAATIKAIVDKKTKPEDFAKPGHLFPLVCQEGGVLAREGHTEASVDLVKLAGLYPAAVICEIINEDGSMAKLEQLLEFSRKHDIIIVAIKDLIGYLKRNNTAEKNV